MIRAQEFPRHFGADVFLRCLLSPFKDRRQKIDDKTADFRNRLREVEAIGPSLVGRGTRVDPIVGHRRALPGSLHPGHRWGSGCSRTPAPRPGATGPGGTCLCTMERSGLGQSESDRGSMKRVFG